jgi:hypothetical protein
MSSVRNIILLVVLIAGGVAGYFIGARNGQDAKEALAKLEEATKLGEAEHKKTTAELQAQVTSLTTKFEADKKQINADYSAKQDKLSALLGSRDKTIKDLKDRRSGDQSEIVRLRAHMNDPMSAAEKQANLERIAQLEKDRRDTVLAMRGEQCLAVAVPKDNLATLQENKP